MGVEPTTGAWEATVLPLHYGRVKNSRLGEIERDYSRRFGLFKRLFAICPFF